MAVEYSTCVKTLSFFFIFDRPLPTFEHNIIPNDTQKINTVLHGIHQKHCELSAMKKQWTKKTRKIVIEIISDVDTPLCQ